MLGIFVVAVATGGECDEPVCLDVCRGEEVQSGAACEMASDGECLLALNPPNWVGSAEDDGN